jgi:hypothetical protein
MSTTTMPIASIKDQWPSDTVILHGDWILLTSHFFFKDGDRTPVAISRKGSGHMVFLSEEAEQRRDERILKLRHRGRS